MSGDEENLDVVMTVLRILAQHAKDKFSEQQDIASGNLAKLAQQRQDAQDERDRAEMAMEEDLKSQAETLKNRIAALQTRKVKMLRDAAAPAKDRARRATEAKDEQGIGSAKS